jgi:opacity protein-like surface antigen
VNSDYSNSHVEEETMKRVVLITLALVLCMSALIPAQAASGDAALTPSGEKGSFISMAAIGDTLYLLSGTGLYTWQSGDAEP